MGLSEFGFASYALKILYISIADFFLFVNMDSRKTRREKPPGKPRSPGAFRAESWRHSPLLRVLLLLQLFQAALNVRRVVVFGKKVLVRDGQLHIPHHAGGLPGLLHRGPPGRFPNRGLLGRGGRPGSPLDRGRLGPGSGCRAPDRLLRLGRRCGGLGPGNRRGLPFRCGSWGPLFLPGGRGYPLAHRGLSLWGRGAAGRPLGGLLGLSLIHISEPTRH